MKEILMISVMLINCSCVMVQPYQREVLSKSEMQFDSEKTEISAREHFLNSLEGSTGGFGVGGGGCGCN